MNRHSEFYNMTKTIAFALTFLFLASLPLQAQIQATGLTTTAVHLADGSGVVLGSGDFYGSGNDDDFSEFGITTFNVSNPNVTAVNNLTLILTYNDRTFSDGSEVEFFFTPDSAADLGGDFAALSYDPAFVNGINPAQFVTAPVSLGKRLFSPELDGGTEVAHFLDVAAAQDALLTSIQNGTDFQIIIASTAAEADVTFSGVGNTFDPGDPRINLNVDIVPEPSSIGLLSLGLMGIAALRRRRS